MTDAFHVARACSAESLCYVKCIRIKACFLTYHPRRNFGQALPRPVAQCTSR